MPLHPFQKTESCDAWKRSSDEIEYQRYVSPIIYLPNV